MTENKGSSKRGGHEVEAEHLLHDVSHELKSPLTAIRGHAQLLRNRAAREGRAEDERSATIIIEQVQRITGMLDSLMEHGASRK